MERPICKGNIHRTPTKDHLTGANKENTDDRLKTAYDPGARTEANVSLKHTGRPIIPEKTPPPEVLSKLYKLRKGRTGQTRSVSRGVGKSLEKFPRGRGRRHTTTVKNNTQRKRLTHKMGPGQPKAIQGGGGEGGRKTTSSSGRQDCNKKDPSQRHRRQHGYQDNHPSKTQQYRRPQDQSRATQPPVKGGQQVQRSLSGHPGNVNHQMPA